MAKISIRIEELEKIVSDTQKEIDEIKNLVNIFPDLEYFTDRWNKIRYASRIANNKVTNYYTKHSCGCCSDAPLDAYPYLTVNEVKVHSNPESFWIGDKSYFNESGYSYNPKIIDNLKEADINPEIIAKIAILIKNDDDY